MKFTLQPLPHPSRSRAIDTIKDAPDGYVVEIKPSKRSLDQNAILWATLEDVSKQVIWHGNTLTPEEWKHVFTAALTRQKVVPGLDGGFVVLGQSTSRMTKKEMTDLIDLIGAFCAEHRVILHGNEE